MQKSEEHPDGLRAEQQHIPHLDGNCDHFVHGHEQQDRTDAQNSLEKSCEMRGRATAAGNMENWPAKMNFIYWTSGNIRFSKLAIIIR